MIGKNPLFVARQHGHSLVTMWRTYAAWMDGALESDIGLIRAVEGSAPEAPELVPSSMQRDSAAPIGLTLADRLSNTESRLPREGSPVAEFGTRFGTRCGTLATQVPVEQEKESGGESGIRRGSACYGTYRALLSPAIPLSPRISHQICHRHFLPTFMASQ
jgi:hypothetical protein